MAVPKIPLRTKSRFVPAPSKARLKFYNPGGWKSCSHSGKRPGRMGMLRHRAGGCSQSQVSPDKNSFVGKHFQRGDVHRAKNNGGLSLGWGLSQNPTNNKMWMRPLGKQGEEKIPGTCEQNCTSSRKGKVIQVIEVTQTPKNLDPSQIPASPPECLAN